MSFFETPDYSKVKVTLTPGMMWMGFPPPEKWKGLELARTVGSKGWTFDNLLEDTKKLIGFENETRVGIRMTPYRHFSEFVCQEHMAAHGDENPLYTDPNYAKNTRYGCMLVYPTLLHTVRYGMTHGLNGWGPWPVSTLVSGLSWDYYDVIRVNTRFRSSMKLRDVVQKKGRTGRLMLMLTDTSFWDGRNRLIASGGGIYIDVGKAGEDAKKAQEAVKKGEGMSKTMLYDRPTYRYSEEEVKKIVADVNNEDRRGATPRYWEDVEVGDKLTPVVKGPFRIHEIGWVYMGRHAPRGLSFRHGVTVRPSANPLTGWPFDGSQHEDFYVCNRRGLPGPFDHGIQRMTMASHLLSNWMGDDGFLRRCYMQVRKPCYYGDVLWYNGEVVKVYKDKVCGEINNEYTEVEYGAVDISVPVVNQVGEVTLPTTATVYLPSRELGDVKLPIPIPTKEDWKLVTKRDVGDFIEEFTSGETIFPSLPAFLGREEE